MLDFIVLGLLLGIGVSAVQREFATREIIGFSMLGIGGALYGNFVASMINTYLTEPNLFITPLLIVTMSLLFMGIKILLLRRNKPMATDE